MKIRILAVGQKMPKWVSETFSNYNQRLNKSQQLELIEIPPVVRNKSTTAEKAKETEGERILSKLKASEIIVLFDEKGKSISTKELAHSIQNWQMQGQDIALIIGGADGVSHQIKQKAKIKWSLSALTFPHPLVRVILAEQIYRAYSLLSNHPYHLSLIHI